MTPLAKGQVIDPLKFKELMWPHITFYDKQREIIYSVNENDETVVPAGNMLGKDFVSGFIALYFFLSRNPCRVITTSVKDDHLRVLWGEIGRLIDTAAYPLRSTEGGNLICNHQEIKKLINGKLDAISYLKGMVASDGAAMQGHHVAKTGDGIKRTLFLVDEASGVQDEYHKMASTWANSMLIIGNPWECQNFFKHAVKGRPGTEDKGGNILREESDPSKGYYRRVIKIQATDSPNVRYGLKEVAKGFSPTDTMILPGVLSYAEYAKRRRLWDKIKQCVSLDGEFYEGAEVMMFPPEWLNLANQLAISQNPKRKGLAIGCDPAEGGDSSSWSVVDDDGLIELVSLKTPDTTFITRHTIKLYLQYGVDPSNIWFDRGGGGKQHADRLRDTCMGCFKEKSICQCGNFRPHNVKTVSFGEPASEVDRFKKATSRKKSEKVDDHETRTIYKNRRAEMYGIIRELIDPSNDGFGIPAKYTELRRQLAPIPLMYDGEGKMYLLPKHKSKPDSKELTLFDLLGCSPDEADSFALAVFGLMEASHPKIIVGAVDVTGKQSGTSNNPANHY